MKKLIAVMLIAVMAVSLFAACAGNQTKPADPTAAPVVTEAPAAEIPATEAPAPEVPVTEAPAAEVPETEAPATEAPETTEPAPADNFVDLNGFYTITDPEGVEYDQRIVLYAEITEEYDATMYAAGIRHDFCVVYGKDNQGVFSYEVVVLETEEQAAAYAERNGGTQDGVCAILESDASYFEMMSAFLPDLEAYINMMVSMGMTDISNPAPAENSVNLKDLYTVTDPEGVEYDQRIVLYAEITEEYDATMYTAGVRHDFCVVYGKDNQGVFSYEVVVLETEEQAAAYAERNEGKQDGVCVVLESDASYFEMMSAFLPDLQAYIDMMKSMGMTELD